MNPAEIKLVEETDVRERHATRYPSRARVCGQRGQSFGGTWGQARDVVLGLGTQTSPGGGGKTRAGDAGGSGSSPQVRASAGGVAWRSQSSRTAIENLGWGERARANSRAAPKA
jgi:hypothetical protein